MPGIEITEGEWTIAPQEVCELVSYPKVGETPAWGCTSSDYSVYVLMCQDYPTCPEQFWPRLARFSYAPFLP